MKFFLDQGGYTHDYVELEGEATLVLLDRTKKIIRTIDFKEWEDLTTKYPDQTKADKLSLGSIILMKKVQLS